MRFLPGRRTVSCLLLLLAAYCANVLADGRQCDGGAVRVEGGHDQDVEAACEAVTVASSFFAAAGLGTPKGLVVRLVSERPSALIGEHEIGRYDARRHEVVMLDYRSYRATTTPDVPATTADEALASVSFWQSWIVHELTHAAVYAACPEACLSHALHEYIAAVAQLATLDEDVRRKFLAAYDELEGFDEMSHISEVYYALNPRYFIVKAYKHFRSQPDWRLFLRRFVATLHRQ